MITASITQKSELTAAELTIAILDAFQRRNFLYAYLRNYEQLPNEIGNDVDLLVAPGKRNQAFSIINETILGTGWLIFKRIEFGPISLYLCSTDCSRFLHIDLFDRIEWHWVPFADTSDLLKNRLWNGIVHHLEICDEVYLNVMTRLGYAGVVRVKHLIQAGICSEQYGEKALVDKWVFHLGRKAGFECGGMVARGDWTGLHEYAQQHLPRIQLSLMLRSPLSSLIGILRYWTRSLRRILRPPGPVIAWEGGDTARRKAVVAAIAIMLKEMTGREDITIIKMKPATGIFGCLIVWRDWLYQVFPSTIKNRAVILLCEAPCHRGIYSYLVPNADVCLDPTGGFARGREALVGDLESVRDEDFIDAAKQLIISRLCRNPV